jgi:hypothetical protein
MKYQKIMLGAASLALVLFSASCLNGATSSESTTTTVVIQPKPSVTFTAGTSGTQEKFFAILDISVRNDGADGVVIVKAIVTQGGQTQQAEQSMYITRNSKQPVRMVFPLIWKGGTWTPNVTAEVP